MLGWDKSSALLGKGQESQLIKPPHHKNHLWQGWRPVVELRKNVAFILWSYDERIDTKTLILKNLETEQQSQQ